MGIDHGNIIQYIGEIISTIIGISYPLVIEHSYGKTHFFEVNQPLVYGHSQ